MTSMRSAAATGLPEKPADIDQRRALFLARHSALLTARAEVGKWAVSQDVSDAAEKASEVADEQVERCERSLMTTHAPLPWMFWIKLQILEEEIAADILEGPRADHRCIWMLACIKADLMVLGIGGHS